MTGPVARVLALTLAVLAGVSLSVVPAAAVARNPVIFVHGYNGSSAGWAEMISDFRAAGYQASELHAWNYDSHQSNRTTAQQFAGYVDQVRAATGAAEVDVVTHSMGGLSTRWYVKFLGGSGSVNDWVSLAGPNHGTDSAWGCFDPSCSDMRPGSDFLTTLNAGDETPGGADYGTWWSSCDGVIMPADSTVLSGANNTRTGCIAHSAFLTNDAVSQQVRDFVAAS